MKKLAYILSLFAGGMLTVTSCDLEAPAKSTLSTDLIFSTEGLADAAVMAIHESFGQTNSYRGRFIPYFGINTDCEIYNNYADDSKDPYTDKEISLAVYSASADNTYMNTTNNAWNYMYEGIERANKALEGMKENADLTNANLAQLYGELLTLRSFIYFDLVKAWGDVPYRFESNTSETIYLPRTDRVTVLKKVLDDLLEAENYLGWPNENSYTTSVERCSKAFAKGLRARVALFLAGYSQWPNEGLRYNIQDETERREMYKIALDECASVINQGCNQLGSFEQNFRNLCEENVSAGQESIYEIPFASGRGRVLYTWGGKHAEVDQWTKLAKGGINGPTPTLWYDYDKDDVRRDITCLPYTWDGDKTTSNKTISGTSGGGWSFGKLRFEWMKRIVTSTNDDGINFQVMRYADIYLMAAEAENMLNGPSNAGQYMQPVLNRAYPSDKVSTILSNATASQEAFQQEIMDQRKFEFAGEAIRKVDLMRWGQLSNVLAETKAKIERLAKRTGEYSGYPAKIYYNEGLDAAPTDADGYTVYGLEAGDTDDYGKENFTESSYWFTFREEGSGSDDEANKNIQENNTRIQRYIDYLYVNDPNEKMFWPIWKVFIDGSNGQLVNYYGY